MVQCISSLWTIHSSTFALLVVVLVVTTTQPANRLLVVGLSSVTPLPTTKMSMEMTQLANLDLQQKSLSTTKSSLGWISPHESFRNTISGELTVVSLNCLAPSLFGLDPNIDEDQDRMTRYPKAVELATRLNADVLCLQEVEGGTNNNLQHHTQLEHLLQQDSNNNNNYEFHWVPLHPKRKEMEIVGLCVAWKPHKLSLVSSRNFARGMVVQLQQKDDGSRFCIGNVHLPARPANIAGRLHTISNLIRNIQSMDTRLTTKTPLDGSVIVAGDFNGDSSSLAVQLLQNGSIQSGMHMDRNYRMKLTKAEAVAFQHDFRFLNAYQGVKDHLTVSLKGRGPGIMDHIAFATNKLSSRSSRPSNNDSTHQAEAKMIVEQAVRQKRRKRGQAKTVNPKQERELRNNHSDRLVVQTRLATLDQNVTRTQIIEAGLPAPEFPTDHLPVGVLLGPNRMGPSEEEDGSSQPVEIELDAHDTRQRHDTLLRSVSSWLVARGATDIIQDQTLYEWKWTQGMEKQQQQQQQMVVRNKMRAPDICFVHDDTKLIMIEVTAVRVNRTVRAMKQKQLKYRDLALALSRAPMVQQAALQVLEPIVIVVPANGDLPEETLGALNLLAMEVGASPEQMQELASDLIRVRNHWTG
jgi:endonuclease/exonuclease/phosphatase family metal-dependent hydrolase